MKYQLSFCTLIILTSSIVELCINEGVEVTLEMVGEYHDFLIEKMEEPFSVLIDTVNSYTLTFDAQRYINFLGGLQSVAIVSYRKQSEIVNKYISGVGLENKTVLLFTGKEPALEWLYDQSKNQ